MNKASEKAESLSIKGNSSDPRVLEEDAHLLVDRLGGDVVKVVKAAETLCSRRKGEREKREEHS